MAGPTPMTRIDHLVRFYGLLDAIAENIDGPVALSDLDLKSLPQRGIYFFFEPGEERSESGNGARVVRVGTHGLKDGAKSTLSQRLRQHRGTKSGRGNHRGSIFRLLVGQALVASGRHPLCETWGLKGDVKSASHVSSLPAEQIKISEGPVEEAASRHLGEMSVLWVNVPDAPGPDSLRGLIERNSIALLSNVNGQVLDPPSSNWLGCHSQRDLVRRSGLWNQNHVKEDYDPRFLDILEQCAVRSPPLKP